MQAGRHAVADLRTQQGEQQAAAAVQGGWRGAVAGDEADRLEFQHQRFAPGIGTEPAPKQAAVAIADGDIAAEQFGQTRPDAFQRRLVEQFSELPFAVETQGAVVIAHQRPQAPAMNSSSLRPWTVASSRLSAWRR
jgi:hypothetical protein